jgi:hypothetical protein
MKRLLSLTLIVGLAFGANAQDKKLRAGLVTGFTVNSLKVQTTKIEKFGLGAGFTIGMAGDYNINDNIAISSGIQFDLESFKVNYGSATNNKLGQVFYGYSDTDILTYKDGVVKDATDTTAFELMTRKFRSKYVTIPLFLKFQTNMIGSFRYYGKFGLRTSILAGVRMDDYGYTADYDLASNSFDRIGTDKITIDNMKPVGIKKGLTPVRMGIGIYGGTEWNFTGNTYLFVEAGFNYGITPNLYQNSGHLVDKVGDATNGYKYENLNVKSNPQHIFELKVGLLF